MSNTFITFIVLSKDPVAIKYSQGSSLGVEKQFLKVRSRNYLPFSSNGGDTQTLRLLLVSRSHTPFARVAKGVWLRETSERCAQ